MSTAELTVWLVGGDRLIRECFRQLLAAHVEIVAAEATVDPLLARMAGDEAPRCIICLEAGGDPVAFVESLRRIRSRWAATRIVVLMRGNDLSGDMVRSLNTLVDGCFCSDMGLDALVHALKAVMLGDRLWSSRLVQAAFGEPGARAEAESRILPLPANLTGRQQQILGLLVEGCSNKEIARRCDLSEATVKVQVRAILRRLGVDNRTQAAVWARRFRLPEPQPRAGRPTGHPVAGSNGGDFGDLHPGGAAPMQFPIS